MDKNKMGIMPIKKLMITMSLPVIFSMMVQAMYNVIDSIFVSQINEQALTALSLAFPLQLIVIAVFVGLGIGINSLISRKLGEGDTETAVLAAEHGVMLGLIVYALVAIFGLVFSRPFFTAFTQDQLVIEYAIVYTRIIMGFSFGRILAQAGMSVFQGTGQMVPSMIAQLIGAVTNIILDPILIFGLFGAPEMGVAGAATATVVAQGISMIYVWSRLLLGKGILKPNLRTFKAQWVIMKQIIVVGLPAAINQGLASVMLTVFNLILSAYGDSAIAVMGAYYKLQSMVFMPVFGMATGSMPVFGFNYGARLKERMMEAIGFSITVAVSFMTICLVIFQVFPVVLLNLYNSSDEMLAIGVPAFRTISLMFPLVGAIIMIATIFPAIGKAHYSLIVNLIRQFGILIPMAYLLGELAGINAVWFAFIITEVVGLLVAISFMKYALNKIVWTKTENSNEKLISL